MNLRSKKVIAAYIPVIHRGYIHFLKAHADASEIYIFDSGLLKKVDYLRKDLRALKPGEVVAALSKLVKFDEIAQLSDAMIKKLDQDHTEIIMPDEDISRQVSKSFKKAKISFSPVFLRWDRQNVDQPDSPAEESKTKTDKRLMRKAVKAAAASSDIWRQVGAVLVAADGQEIGAAYNRGEPTEHSPSMEGDPRNIFFRGVSIEMSVFTHAEASLIAAAAKSGTSTKGASMYVTAFPCPACAKLIAHSGIKNIYYKDGYAILDGKRVLEDYKVRIRRVPLSNSGPNDPAAIPYKKSI